VYFSVFDDDSRLQKIKEIKKDFRERVYKSSSSLSSSSSVSVLCSFGTFCRSPYTRDDLFTKIINDLLVGHAEQSNLLFKRYNQIK